MKHVRSKKLALSLISGLLAASPALSDVEIHGATTGDGGFGPATGFGTSVTSSIVAVGDAGFPAELGALEINQQSTLTADSLFIGEGELNSGLVHIDNGNLVINGGPGAPTGPDIGNEGTGTLIAQTGSFMEWGNPLSHVDQTSIGTFPASSGMLVVRDLNTSLTSTGHILVGDQGRGAMVVDSNASVVLGNPGSETAFGHLSVPGATGARGAVDVRNNATVSVNKLFVANDDSTSGTVNITSGATLTHRNGFGVLIGQGDGASGTVNVDGGALEVFGEDPDPNWNGAAWANIGRRGGTGTLNVFNGGSVLFEFTGTPQSSFPEPGMNVGRADDSVGTVTLRGSSTLTVNGRNPTIQVARGNSPNPDLHRTTGLMEVTGGSDVFLNPTVPPAFFRIAREPGSVGTLIVEDAGSTLNVGDSNPGDGITAGSGELCVGGNCSVAAGDGTLIVRNGGVVNACEVTIASTGRQILDGGTINACASTVRIFGETRVSGDSVINGGVALDAGGTVSFDVDPSGTPAVLTVGGETELNGVLVVNLPKGLDPEDLTSLDVVQTTDPDPTGLVDIIIVDDEGEQVAIFTDVDTSEEGGLNFRPMAIDIKPGSDTNPINRKARGKTPVAIFSTPSFDATTIDVASIDLAGATVAAKGNDNKFHVSNEDVNNDGLQDLVIRIETQELQLTDNATLANLKAEADGVLIRGSDAVTIVR